ncbi:hypothetical protein [Arthrobacter sp. H5]|uniref:hypothetical protein n=1 Tax=Arthrobacter sp. H5 TaxID=1267973 RepID=UPI000560C64A|nr:hypothetical protein [Arthrobacter sp. H5]
MPQAVDVGSVLGGRYKVTAYVLASAERDLVLDGVDQVLNRPVSILVASPTNASQLATSAREVAVGERSGNIQVLDLGITDAGTYLVTNRAPAADLLDLVIQQEDAPYIEPFFTDTLGSEIFGVPRSTEPETDEDDDEDYHEERPSRRSRLPKARMPRFGRGAGAAGAGAAGTAYGQDQNQPRTAEQELSAPAQNAGRAEQGGASVPPPPSSPPRIIAADESSGQKPKVSLWSEDDYGFVNEERREAHSGAEQPAPAERPASRFPAAAGGLGAANAPEPQYDYEDEYESGENDRENNPRYTRILVGAVLAIVIIVAVVFAVNQISPMFNTPPPAANENTPSEEAPETTEGATESPAESAAPPTEEPVAPVAASVTRLVPGNEGLNADTDGDLPLIIDNNPASFWGSLVFANDVFGGLAQNMALIVELEEESAVSEIQIEQLNSSGGNFTVLLNDEPTLEGATQIAQTGFTGPSVNIPVPEVDGAAPTARYVIINITQLPRLSNVQAQYPWGVRIAEINVS